MVLGGRMAEPVDDGARLGWLDGLRGVAAVQVVLLHYVSAFLPAVAFGDPRLAHFGWEHLVFATPLFLPFDGYFAVFIFFVLSGVALTCSFAARPFALATGVARRVVRLGLPMAAAVLLGGALFALVPAAHVAAGLRSRSDGWLAVVAPEQISIAAMAHQIVFEGMLAGYRDTTMLPPQLAGRLGLALRAGAFNAPLWTLHIEFFGSLLVLLLVAMRALVGRATHLAICLMLLASLVASPLSLFIVGHLAAPWLRRPAIRRRHVAAATALLLLGGLLATTPELTRWLLLQIPLPVPLLGPAIGGGDLKKMVGAGLVFAGVGMLPALQAALCRPALRRLGRLSFALYLTHFPVLFTVTSAVFVAVGNHVSYAVAVVLASLLGLAVSAAAAVAFERWVDRPATALSRRVSISLIGGARVVRLAAASAHDIRPVR